MIDVWIGSNSPFISIASRVWTHYLSDPVTCTLNFITLGIQNDFLVKHSSDEGSIFENDSDALIIDVDLKRVLIPWLFPRFMIKFSIWPFGCGWRKAKSTVPLNMTPDPFSFMLNSPKIL